jgi:spermidine synthase
MGSDAWQRWLSWAWPVRMAQVEGRHGTLEVRWENGRKVLNSPNGNQSFGSLHRVWQRVFQDAGVQTAPPTNVLLLGLGGGSAVHILRRELGIAAPITAVEIDPAMVALAREHFALDSMAAVTIVQGDAVIQVQALRERFDLIIVDLFDDLDLARGIDTMGFAHGLRERCTDGGKVLFNTVAHDPHSAARCERVNQNLIRVFHAVDTIQLEEVNRVFVAR